MTPPESTLGLHPRDARLIERLHGDLPLIDHPFAAVGAELGMDEDEVLERLRRLLSQGVLTRFGPLYQIERAGGQFVLAALEVPPERFDAVAQQINALPEVAHNYRREHAFNMWFVLACRVGRADRGRARPGHRADRPAGARVPEGARVLRRTAPADSAGPEVPPMALDDFDRRLIAATQSGLPLVPRPYEAVGAMLGVSGEEVRERLAAIAGRAG